MHKAFQTFFAGLITILLLTTAVVLATGNISWGPARDAAARQQVAAVESVRLAQPEAQATVFTDPAQEQLAELYRTIMPSVVNIQVTQRSVATSGFGIQRMPQQGQGSGWVWDDQGHIVTNNHVVENAAEIIVYFHNGLWAEAELVAADPQADLAVIRVTQPDGVVLQPLARAQEIPPVGYYAFAFGSPFGLAGTMTRGIISAVGRSFPVSDVATGVTYSLPEVIQTDAAVNPGNSGGPLVDLNGQVIGVNFAIRSEVRANSGVGFAIPVTIVHRVVPALIEQGGYRYSYLGIAGTSVTPAIVRQADLPRNTLGVIISRVVGRPAAEAGLRSGDIMIAIDDVEVRNYEDMLSYLLIRTEPGQVVQIRVTRNGNTLTLPLTVGERPRQETPEG
jgi:S1-C subfamily serine protease